MRLKGRVNLQAVMAVVALLMVSGALSVVLSQARPREVAAAPPPAAPPAVNHAIASLEQAFESVAENAGKSVVTISVRMKETPRQQLQVPFGEDEDPLKNLPPQYRDFFKDFGPRGKQFYYHQGPDGEKRSESPESPKPTPPPADGPRPYTGMGSGFVIRKDGHILTNAHVVRNAEELAVRLSDGSVAKAKIVGQDDTGDIAVIKAETDRDLPVSTLGDSDAVRVGQFAVTVGTPMGMKGTVSVGIVSGINRTLLGAGNVGRSSMIQTDAHITFGNSGGPLCNLKGEVIGINSMITREGSVFGDANSGFGFAIPINEAKKVADQLIQHGKVSRGYLGISPRELMPEIAEKLKVNRGVLVQEVHEGTPGEKAGLKKDDVIQKVDGKDIVSPEELQAEVRKHSAGERIALHLIRDGKPQEITVTLADLPKQLPTRTPGKRESDKKDEKQQGKPAPHEEKSPGPFGKPTPAPKQGAWRGMGVQDLDAAAREYYKLAKDAKGALVSVVEDSGPAATANIEVGDVVKEVNRQPVASAKDFESIVKGLGNKPALLLVTRDGKTKLATVNP